MYFDRVYLYTLRAINTALKHTTQNLSYQPFQKEKKKKNTTFSYQKGPNG